MPCPILNHMGRAMPRQQMPGAGRVEELDNCHWHDLVAEYDAIAPDLDQPPRGPLRCSPGPRHAGSFGARARARAAGCSRIGGP